jgi:hypothetical protein
MKSLTIFLCASMAMGFITIWPFQFDPSAEKHQPNSEQFNKNPKPSVTSTLKGSEPKKPEKPSDNHTEQSDPKAVRITEVPPPDTWYKAYVFSTIIMALITISLAVIGFCGIRTANRSLRAVESQSVTLKGTLEAIKRQADNMDRQTSILEASVEVAKASAKAAQASVDIFIAKERARISVNVKDLVTSAEFVVRFEISCYCPTPALDVEGSVEACAIAELPGMFGRMERAGVPKTIENSGVTSYNVLVNKYRGKPASEDVLSGKLPVIFYGTITYRDVFQRPGDPPHIEKFRYKWTGRPPKNPGDALGCWEVDVEEDRNYEI